MQKLEVDDKLDYCKVEFDYAMRKGFSNFITIVMDTDMRRAASQSVCGSNPGGCAWLYPRGGSK